MNPRRHLPTAALALSLLAGCSSRTPPPSEAMATESGGTPAPATGTPAPAAANPASSDSPSGGSAAGGNTALASPTTYFVRDSGVRCIAPPCPAFVATRPDRPNEDGLLITDVDLNSLGLSEAQRDSFLEATHTAPGVKVEASVGTGASLGPNGPAKILHITKLHETK